MNRMPNQEIERYYFEQFRINYSVPPGNIIYGDRPDIIIEGNNRLGIEITNFYTKEGSLLESEQIQGKLRKNVILRAQDKYLMDNKGEIEISFGFDENIPIKNKNKLIGNLVNLAKRIENCEAGGIRKDFFQGIPELSFVYLNPGPYEDAKWRVVQVYDVPIMSRDRLIQIVKNKECCARKYNKCDTYWLLVIIDFINPAQDQDIIHDGFEKIQTEIFEKVIVYKTIFGDVLEAKKN